MSKLSRERRIYLAIWRKALLNRLADLPDLIIPMEKGAQALTFRMNMYNAIKPYRHEEEIDNELHLAATTLVCHAQMNPPMIIMRQGVGEALAFKMAEEIGITEKDLELESEREVREKAEKSLQDLMNDPIVKKHSDNPFYTKGE